MTASRSYRRLSVAEKERYQRERIREPAITCPACEVQTTVENLLDHLDRRCPGLRPPHHASRWVSWEEATQLVHRRTLRAWVRRGVVRVGGDEQSGRLYLLRDVIRHVALQRLAGKGKS